jgi:hypothetical protein
MLRSRSTSTKTVLSSTTKAVLMAEAWRLMTKTCRSAKAMMGRTAKPWEAMTM